MTGVYNYVLLNIMPNPQKGIIHFLPLLLLAIGLIAGVYLMTSGSPLKIFPKAGGAPILFKSVDGNLLSLNSQGVAQSNSTSVKVEITSPFGADTSATASYRGALNPSELQKVEFSPFSENPTEITVEFPNKPGTQFYWVEFKGADGKIDRRSAKIEIKVSGSAATPSPKPSCVPLPTPPDCADDDPPCQVMPPAPGTDWCPASSPSSNPSGLPSAKPSGSPIACPNGQTAYFSNCSCSWICADQRPLNDCARVCESPLPTPAVCTPRPACLDQNPRCLISEPTSGWCPSPIPTPVPGSKSDKR